MSTLAELAIKYGTDKGPSSHDHNWHNYTALYDTYFKAGRERYLKLLEIGVLYGASTRMWRDYFKNGLIFGMDNYALADEQAVHTAEMDRVRICYGSQDKIVELENMIYKFGGEFDIIIDDASHVNKHQQISLGYLFSHLKSNGIYAIEDLSLPKEHEENNTATLLTAIKHTDKFPSDYISDEKQKYICDNIKSVEVYKIGKMQKGKVISDQSIIAMITKK